MKKKPIRIGLLTFSRSINYGAFLQCYSLQSKLKSLTYEVKVINYNLPLVEFGFLIQSLIRGIGKGLLQYKAIKKSANANIDLTRKMISSNTGKTIDFINSLKFDLIIAGSDEIWKLNRFRKYPNIYWLSTPFNAKKISYGASANRTYISNIPAETKQDMKEELRNYLYLGVRDKHTFDFLKSLGLENDAFENCDPAFFYESQETPLLKQRLTEKYHLDLEKPIIGLVSGNKKVGLSIREKFGEKYQIVSITNNNPYADCFLYDLNPFEWANVFKLFSGCVTSYFHGMVFSIKNEIPFIAFDSEEYSLIHNSKIFDLIFKYDLNSCYENLLKEPVESISGKLAQNMRNVRELAKQLQFITSSEIRKWENFENKLLMITSKIAHEE